jgi:hypothetical protein
VPLPPHLTEAQPSPPPPPPSRHTAPRAPPPPSRTRLAFILPPGGAYTPCVLILPPGSADHPHLYRTHGSPPSARPPAQSWSAPTGAHPAATAPLLGSPPRERHLSLHCAPRIIDRPQELRPIRAVQRAMQVRVHRGLNRARARARAAVRLARQAHPAVRHRWPSVRTRTHVPPGQRRRAAKVPRPRSTAVRAQVLAQHRAVRLIAAPPARKQNAPATHSGRGSTRPNNRGQPGVVAVLCAGAAVPQNRKQHLVVS